MTDTFTTTIRRGIPWARTLTVSIDDVPVDFTGYEAIVRIGDIELTEDAGVTLDDEGNVTIALTAEQTASILPQQARITIDLVSSGGVAFEPRINGLAAVER